MKSLYQYITEASKFDGNKEIQKIIKLNSSRLHEEPSDSEWWNEYGWAYFDDSESYVTDGFGLFISDKIPEAVAKVIIGIAKNAIAHITGKKAKQMETTTDSDAKSAGYNTYFWPR